MTTRREPKTIGALIDALERIREELFHLQSEMEELESDQKPPPGDEPQQT
jgi:hypothetical protein